MFSELILLLLAIFYINVKLLNHNCFILCQNFNVSIILSDITNSIEIACTRINIEYQTSRKFHGNLSIQWKGKVSIHKKVMSVRMTSFNLLKNMKNRFANLLNTCQFFHACWIQYYFANKKISFKY